VRTWPPDQASIPETQAVARRRPSQGVDEWPIAKAANLAAVAAKVAADRRAAQEVAEAEGAARRVDPVAVAEGVARRVDPAAADRRAAQEVAVGAQEVAAVVGRRVDLVVVAVVVQGDRAAAVEAVRVVEVRVVEVRRADPVAAGSVEVAAAARKAAKVVAAVVGVVAKVVARAAAEVAATGSREAANN
jgi:hypothetical protein